MIIKKVTQGEHIGETLTNAVIPLSATRKLDSMTQDSENEKARAMINNKEYKKAEKLLKKADVVYLYLLNSVLDKIENWLFDSISPKTRVVSLSFKFKNHKPLKTLPTINLGRKTKIRLYTK